MLGRLLAALLSLLPDGLIAALARSGLDLVRANAIKVVIILALTVIAGLSSSTLLTLGVVPVFYRAVSALLGRRGDAS